MKTIKSLCGMLVLLAFTACSNDSGEVVGNDNHLWEVTLQASMGDAATLRALNAETDGKTITACFTQYDKVVVVDADGSTIVGTLEAQTAGASTTLSGLLNASSLEVDETVTLRYLSATANYDNQDGTLDGIAAHQDYAEETLTVSTTDPLTFTSNSVTLKSKQSITKFKFTDGTNPINVTTFGIAAEGLVQSIAKNGTETVGAVTGTLSPASSEVYVALRNKESGTKTYSFTIQDEDGNWYMFEKNAILANGKNYAVTVTLPTKLPTLSNTDEEGTIGVIDDLPAIVVDLGGTIGKKAVALMNAGALCPEHYGEYYTYAEQSSAVSGGWYVPTQAELTALSSKSKEWVTRNGVNGSKFTIGSVDLFLPAAGYYDTDDTPGFASVSTYGYYWSSTDAKIADYVVILNFWATNAASMDSSINKKHGLSVRPFHSTAEAAP